MKNPDNPTMTGNDPLARHCSLCGDGYHPNLSIEISDEPTDGEYRWSHTQCLTDHDAAFAEAYLLSGGFEEHFEEGFDE